jgi:hypothetical protein
VTWSRGDWGLSHDRLGLAVENTATCYVAAPRQLLAVRLCPACYMVRVMCRPLSHDGGQKRMVALPSSLVDTHQADAQVRGLLGATRAKSFAEQGGIS